MPTPTPPNNNGGGSGNDGPPEVRVETKFVSYRITARLGERKVLLVFGTLRACWPVGLAFVQPGPAGLAVVMVTELGLIVCISLFNSVFAAHQLNAVEPGHHARVLTAWSITGSASIAALTLLWGLLAQLTGPRAALAAAGVLLLATPFLLPRAVPHSEPNSPDRTEGRRLRRKQASAPLK